MISKKNSRSRHRMLGLWVPASDHLAFKQEAARNGYDLSTMLRLRIYGTTKGIRVTRRPMTDVALLGNMLSRLITLTGELNKVGSNLNQIARRLNMGEQDAVGLGSALHHLEAISQNILKVLEQIEAAITNRPKNRKQEEA